MLKEQEEEEREGPEFAFFLRLVSPAFYSSTFCSPRLVFSSLSVSLFSRFSSSSIYLSISSVLCKFSGV